MQGKSFKSVLVSGNDRVLKGKITLPASKSISNRLLMIRALSGMSLELPGLSEADDTQLMTRLVSLVENSSGKKKPVELDAGMAGTVMRFLTAWLSMRPGRWVLTGADRMKQRPIGILVEALRSLGASIDYLAKPGFPPLLVRGGALKGGELVIDPGVSSQFVSALLMVAPCLPGGLRIVMKGKSVSTPYILMTVRMMQAFGATVREQKHSIRVLPGKYAPGEFVVESDWSAAAPWYEAAAFSGEVDLEILGLHAGSLQGDAVLPAVYQNFGVATEFTREGIRLSRFRKKIDGFYFDFNDYPDIAQSVIATCAGLQIRGRFEGLKSLQIKETDRLRAMRNEIGRLGIDCQVITQGENFVALEIKPGRSAFPSGLTFETYGDHRMAMAIAPLAMKAGPIRIMNPDVVQKSYPWFWKDMQDLGFEIQ